MNEDQGQPAKTGIPVAHLEKDPVCGMDVNPTNSRHFHEHGGKKYYFCSGHCVEKFKTSPEKYLGKPAPTGLVTLGMPAVRKPDIPSSALKESAASDETANRTAQAEAQTHGADVGSLSFSASRSSDSLRLPHVPPGARVQAGSLPVVRHVPGAGSALQHKAN